MTVGMTMTVDVSGVDRSAAVAVAVLSVVLLLFLLQGAFAARQGMSCAFPFKRPVTTDES
jgi:hypothetical protein